MDSEFDYDRMISVRASVIEDGEARIKELEAELAYERERNTNNVAINTEEISRLRECLKRIAEHPHCSPIIADWAVTVQGQQTDRAVGHVEGHRCAAEIAREGLTASGPSESKPTPPPRTR